MEGRLLDDLLHYPAVAAFVGLCIVCLVWWAVWLAYFVALRARTRRRGRSFGAGQVGRSLAVGSLLATAVFGWAGGFFAVAGFAGSLGLAFGLLALAYLALALYGLRAARASR